VTHPGEYAHNARPGLVSQSTFQEAIRQYCRR
jgi:hypothetical protein